MLLTVALQSDHFVISADAQQSEAGDFVRDPHRSRAIVRDSKRWAASVSDIKHPKKEKGQRPEALCEFVRATRPRQGRFEAEI